MHLIVKQGGRDRNDAAGFNNQAGIQDRLTHGLRDLLLADGDDVVGEFSHMSEGQVSDAGGAHAVGARPASLVERDLDDAAAVKASARVISNLGLDADDLGRGTRQLQGGRHTRQQPSTADWHENDIRLRLILEYLQTYGSRAGDDEFILEGRHHDEAPLARQLFGFKTPVLFTAAFQLDYGGSQSRRLFLLDLRSERRHDDGGFDPQGPRRVGDALSVIATGERDAATCFFLL